MSEMKIVKETLAKKCEICHKRDCFDAQTKYCSRCSKVNRSFIENAKHLYFSKLIMKQLLSIVTSIGIGTIVGAVIQGANNGVLHFSYLSLFSPPLEFNYFEHYWDYTDSHFYKMLTFASTLLSILCVLVVGIVVWPINLNLSKAKWLTLLLFTFVKRTLVGGLFGLIFAFWLWGVFMIDSYISTRLGAFIGAICGLVIVLQNQLTQKFYKYHS